MKRLLAIGSVTLGLWMAGMTQAQAQVTTWAQAQEIVAAAHADGAFLCRGTAETLWYLIGAACISHEAGDDERCLLILNAALQCVRRTGRTGLPAPLPAYGALILEPWLTRLDDAILALIKECSGE